MCADFSGNIGPVGGTAQFCGVVSYDSSGNPQGVGTTETLGLGAAAGEGGSAVISYQRSNAEHIHNLGGPFMYTSGCAGGGPALGGGTQSGLSNGKVVSVGEIGVGPGGGASGQIGGSNTWTQTWLGS